MYRVPGGRHFYALLLLEYSDEIALLFFTHATRTARPDFRPLGVEFASSLEYPPLLGESRATTLGDLITRGDSNGGAVTAVPD